MNPLNEPLEASNGTFAILTAYCAVFGAVHLYRALRHKRLTWARFICWLPLGLQIAMATLIVSVSVNITQASVWWWRFSTDSDPVQLVKIVLPLIAGNLIGIFGFLWFLRTISRTFGDWPMWAAVGTVLAFLCTFLL